jgi:hypothetical protein
MIQTCFCKGCRYNDSHITAYHRCGICELYGHGQLECPKNNSQGYDNSKVNDLYILTQTKPKTLPISKWCTVEDCKIKSTHNTASHQELFSKDEFADEDSPDYYGIKRIQHDSKIKGENLVKDKINTFVKFYWGLQNYIVIRNKNGIIETKAISGEGKFGIYSDMFILGLMEITGGH